MKMKNYFTTLLGATFLCFQSLGQVNYPGGRMAMSFDGNIEDDDDIIALPVSLGLMHAAGLQNKVVHVEYNNNKCGGPNTVQEENNDSPAYAGNDALHMRTSAQGMITRYGYNATLLYDHTTQGNEAVSHLAAEINLSSASNPLFIIAAGPMESIWRALNASDRAKHAHVFVVSHSQWNQNYARCASSSHDWVDLKNDFPTAYYVQNGNSSTDPHQLADQNGNLNTDIPLWDWMKNSSDANLKWMHSRNPFSGKFDPSDAGMVYFVLSGGPLNGGKKKPTITDIKNLLTNPITDGNLAPAVSFSSPAANANFPVGTSVNFTAIATDSDGSIASVLFTSGSQTFLDSSAPYQATFTYASAGNYTINATATDNKGKKSIGSRSISIGTIASGNPVVSFLQPLNGASTGKNIVVKASAADSDGSISNVKLYLDGAFVRQENVSPYVWNSTVGGSLDPKLSNLSSGTHELKAVATDNSGKMATAIINITVTAAARLSLNSDLEIYQTYPNPCKDQVSIFLGDDNEIKGAKLLSSEGFNTFATAQIQGEEIIFQTSHLPKGIYFVHIETINGPIVQKIIKE